MFYNTGILIGVLFLYKPFGLKGLAYGVVLGAFLHFLIQLPVIIKHRFIPRISFKIDFKEIKRMILVSLPRTLGLSIGNIVIIIII